MLKEKDFLVLHFFLLLKTLPHLQSHDLDFVVVFDSFGCHLQVSINFNGLWSFNWILKWYLICKVDCCVMCLRTRELFYSVDLCLNFFVRYIIEKTVNWEKKMYLHSTHNIYWSNWWFRKMTLMRRTIWGIYNVICLINDDDY